MVYGHTFYYGHQFISLFNMPLFFIISGYFFKNENYENLKKTFNFILKRIKSLVIPFIICNLCFVLLHNHLIEINILTTNPNFLNAEYGNIQGLSTYYDNILLKFILVIVLYQKEQLVGATWFLRALFWVLICFCTVSFLLKKAIKKTKYFEISRFIISISCLAIGFYLQKIDFNFYSIGTMFSGVILIYVGILYKKYKDIITLSLKSFVISLSALIICFKLYPESKLLTPHIKYNPIEFSANYYNNPIMYLICAVSGFICVLFIAKLLNRNKILTNILSIIGQRTMPILCLHLIFFKLVTILQVKIYNLPIYMNASHHILYNFNFWWLVYTVAGLCGPLLLQLSYEKIKYTIKTQFFTKKTQ